MTTSDPTTGTTATLATRRSALTLNRITAAAGVSAAVAGVIYAGVQVNHPPADLDHIVTGEFFVREIAKALMAMLALAGFAGMFVHSRHRLGVLGVVGYLLLSIGYFAMFANQCIVGFVLPTLAETDPGYVQAYLDAAMGGSPGSDIGHMQQLFLITGLGYSIGGLLFGIALFRAGTLARWACVLFAVGTLSVLTLSALPESFSRPFALPAAIALIGLGASLRRRSRTSVDETSGSATTHLATAR